MCVTDLQYISSSLNTEMQELEQNHGVMKENRRNGERTGAAEKTKQFSLSSSADVRDGCNLVCHGSFDSQTATYTTAMESSCQGNSNNDKVFFPVIVNFTVSGWM